MTEYFFSEKRKKEPFSTRYLEELGKNAIEGCGLEGKKVLVLIPDTTRTFPMPLVFKMLVEGFAQKTKNLDFLVASGTHSPPDKAAINEHVGLTSFEKNCHLSRTILKKVKFYTHLWNCQDELRLLGVLPRSEVGEISEGMLDADIPVRINQRIFNYDHILIVGPVFPHEATGFSGGYKYFFPGICGPEMINYSHWLAALITNLKVNGKVHNPVRELINRASELVHIPTTAFCLVLRGTEPHGLFVGEPKKAQEEAARFSGQMNIIHIKRKYSRVIGVAPEMYMELWTAGKCMYKLEPVVAEGGELVIYAPHVREISRTHGNYIARTGYHVRDFFLKKWEDYKNYPWIVLAHSTQVKGTGSFDGKQERPRIKVTLATGIPQKVCKKVNLDYMDPEALNLDKLGKGEKDEMLVVKNAGEQLYLP
jgi:nickel-dependent lactate racemase